MKDQDRSRAQLISELEELRGRVKALEAQVAEGRQSEADQNRITDKKRAEEALRESEERFRAFMDNTPCIAWMKDEDGRYAYLSRTYERRFRARSADWLGKTDFEMWPRETAEQFRRNDQEVLATGRVLEAFEETTNPGGKCYWWIFKFPFQDASGKRYVGGVGVDITERKRAEAGIEAEHAVLEGIMESTRSPVFSVDRSYCYTGFNRSHAATMEAIYGADIKLGKSILDYHTVEEDRSNAKVNLDRTLQGEQFIVEREVGDNFRSRPCFEISHNPIKNAEGHIVGAAIFAQDVTDRKHAEEALRESEERYRMLTESTQDMIAVLDHNGTLLYVNQTAAACVGLPPSEIVGKEQHDVFPPEMAKTHVDRIKMVYETGEAFQEDERFQFGPDEKWLNIQLVPLRDGVGNVASVMIVARDITDRKRAEEASRESEAELRRVMSSVSDYLWSADVTSAGTITYRYFSPAVEAITGRPADFYMRGAEAWLSTIHPDDRSRLREASSRIVDRGSDHEEEQYRVIRPDGTLRWVRDSVVARRKADGGIRLDGVVSDISARKQAEEVLRRAHEELEKKVRERTAELAIFQRLAEASGQGFGMAGLDGTITYVNPALWQLFGEERPEDAVGQPVTRYYPEEYKRRREEEILRALFRDGLWQGEQAILSRQGRLIPTLQSSCLIRDEHGKPICVAVVVADITERKLAQEALERERQSLWHMLQASDHERQTISYEIHDGLAQYLAAASMQFQVFDHLRESDPKQAKMAYDAATQLVRQAHAESRRLISEVRPPVIDETGLEMAISHLVHEQRRRGGPKIEFRANVQFGRLPLILENALYRIIQEAFTNACKHSQSNKVEVTLAQEGQEVRLEVRDWGIGFDPKSVGKGHFGLEGVRQRVRLLDGRLKIESRPGSGSLVQVVVPIVEQRADV